MLEQKRAGDAARQHQRGQRQIDLRVKAFPVFPREDQICRIAQQQVDRRNIGVGYAEAQDRRKHQRIGKAAQALDKISGHRREDP